MQNFLHDLVVAVERLPRKPVARIDGPGYVAIRHLRGYEEPERRRSARELAIHAACCVAFGLMLAVAIVASLVALDEESRLWLAGAAVTVVIAVAATLYGYAHRQRARRGF
jgi:hypothetical protein